MLLVLNLVEYVYASQRSPEMSLPSVVLSSGPFRKSRAGGKCAAAAM